MGNTEFGDVHVDVKCERRIWFTLLFISICCCRAVVCVDDLVQGGQHSDSSICAYADLSHSRALPFFCS